MTSSSSTSTLLLYRRLLKAVRFYPSAKKDQVSDAIRQDFREKRSISGKELERALWLANMELQRLQAWVPTAKQMSEGKDMDVKL